MQTIYKYPLEITDNQVVMMPEGAIILTTQTQNEEVMMWALVNPEAPLKKRKFAIFGTGNPVPDHLRVLPNKLSDPNSKYIGTVKDRGFIWHVFEIL